MDSEDKLTLSSATEEILEHRHSYSIPPHFKIHNTEALFQILPYIYAKIHPEPNSPSFPAIPHTRHLPLCPLCSSRSVPLKPRGSRAPLRVPRQNAQTPGTQQISPLYMCNVTPSLRLAKSTFSPRFGLYLPTNAHYR